jgi:outer membrane protein assembly factor BamB
MHSMSTARRMVRRRATPVRLAVSGMAAMCSVIVLAACGGEPDAADDATLETSTANPTTSSRPPASATVPATGSVPTAPSEVAAPSSTAPIAPTASTAPTSLTAPLLTTAVAAPDQPVPSAPAIGDDVPLIVEPPPDQMCPPGSMPLAAAYDFDDGAVRWAACSEETGWRTVRGVTDDAVYVGDTSRAVTALDPATGAVLEGAPPPPPVEDHGDPPVIEVDGVRVHGEQISRVWATDPNGVELWARPGGWVYADVWAIDDGAVFAVEQNQVLVAYDVLTGDVRWQHRGDPYAEGLWPWHAEGQRLYSMWGNLQVRSTVDGAVIWATQYPWSGAPTGSVHMSGVGTDGDAVFVAFASGATGGD